MISIDATFLNKKYREKLMIATTVNRNNQIFSLKFVIVDEEFANNWNWFLACMRNFITTCQNICLILDRHANILTIVENEHLG